MGKSARTISSWNGSNMCLPEFQPNPRWSWEKCENSAKSQNGQNPDKMPNCRVKAAEIGEKCRDNFVLQWLNDVGVSLSERSEVGEFSVLAGWLGWQHNYRLCSCRDAIGPIRSATAARCSWQGATGAEKMCTMRAHLGPFWCSRRAAARRRPHPWLPSWLQARL